MRIKDIGEFSLIDRLKRDTIIRPESVLCGIGDDAAVLSLPAGFELLAATDMLVEGVHFTLDTATPFEIGYKALAVNVSDIAAMAGLPEQALVSIGLTGEMRVDFIEAIYQGLKECARTYGVNIVGGDTVASPRCLVLNVAILGRVERGRAVYRRGARPGDALLVTGSLGDSAAGLDVMLHGLPVTAADRDYLRQRHFQPQIRVAAARAAAATGAVTAADDISDGLAAELHEIAKAAGVGALVRTAALPLTDAARRAAGLSGKSPLDYAMNGGEDYELLLACRPEGVAAVQAAIQATGTPVAIVGEVLPAQDGLLVEQAGRVQPLGMRGFNHFQSSAPSAGASQG